MQYNKKFQLKKYNSFGIKAIAKEIWFPYTLKELQETAIKLKKKKFFILAGGTNVLLSPYIDRVICLNQMPKYLRLGLKTGVIVSANYSLTSLILKTIEADITGLEGLYGIPGTIGGAILGNAGSGNYTISDYLLSVTTIDYNGILHFYSKESLQFGRRYSILQDKKEIIIEAKFNFKTGIINQYKLNQVKKYRKNFPKGYNAGGIFKNWYALKPYEKELRNIKSKNLKISKQLNVVINNGKATSKEVLNFINKIKKIVKEPLFLEIKIIG